MSGPIHSKGTGRSGPKRKTGCLTCRRRKVRCDETRPVCANCIRLQLDCEYATQTPSSSSLPRSLSAPLRQSSPQMSSSASQASYEDIEPSPMVTSSSFMLPLLGTANYPSDQNPWAMSGHASSSYPLAMQDSSFGSFDSFDLATAFSGSSDAYFGSQDFSTSVGDAGTAAPVIDSAFDITHSEMSPGNGTRQSMLVDYFTISVDPTSLILPVSTEWLHARQGILTMANECTFLLPSILSLSSLHRHCLSQEDCFEEALQFYNVASRETNSFLDGPHLNEQQLRHAFAALFLLTYVELLGQSAQQGKHQPWPLRHLHSFHHRLHQYSDRTRSWKGMSKKLLTWTSLLQIKADWNSGDIALQHCSTPLLKTMTSNLTSHLPGMTLSSESSSRTPSFNLDNTTSEENLLDLNETEPTTNAATLAYNTLNRPGQDFFFTTQILLSRICTLHHEHTSSSTSSQNLQLIKDGQRLSSEIHALWTQQRPDVLPFLSKPSELEDILQPQLARNIILNLRVYMAYFFALFIDLHRRAFATYPASRDVHVAVHRIMALTRDILHDAARGQSVRGVAASSGSTRSGTAGGTTGMASPGHHSEEDMHVAGGALPPMMLWPLFLVATECSAADRGWVLRLLHNMDKEKCPSAMRIVPLLREVLKRQDEEGVRIDHCALRREIGGAELDVFF